MDFKGYFLREFDEDEDEDDEEEEGEEMKHKKTKKEEKWAFTNLSSFYNQLPMHYHKSVLLHTNEIESFENSHLSKKILCIFFIFIFFNFYFF